LVGFSGCALENFVFAAESKIIGSKAKKLNRLPNICDCLGDFTFSSDLGFFLELFDLGGKLKITRHLGGFR
jgi:hypothetical protein